MHKRTNPQPPRLPVVVIFVTAPGTKADKADAHGVYPPDFMLGLRDARA